MVRSDNQDNLFLVNFLPAKCPTKLSERQKIYIRRDLYTFFFVHFLLLVCTSNLSERNYSYVPMIRILSSLIFLPAVLRNLKRQKLLRLFVDASINSDRNAVLSLQERSKFKQIPRIIMSNDQ